MKKIDNSYYISDRKEFEIWPEFTFTLNDVKTSLFIPKNTLAGIPIKTIGIWLSGGADSSILLYALAKLIKDHDIPVTIQPMTSRRGKPWNPMYAADVIDFIVNDLNFNKMEEHICYYPELGDAHWVEIEIFRAKDKENVKNNLYQSLYSGISENPPFDSGLPQNHERKRDPEQIKPIFREDFRMQIVNPISNVNKKGLAELYELLGLTNTLFPITRSCEGYEKKTKHFTIHCGECWWCIERQWAFGRLV